MPDASTKPSGRWQFGLRAVFLLTATIAVWFALYINLGEIADLESRIRSARPLARELVIDDEKKFAAVKVEELWFDENGWDVHLPEGEYRVCLATRQIDGKGLPPTFKSAPIKSGRHRLGMGWALAKEDCRITVSMDGAKLIEATEPKAWDSDSSSSSESVTSVSAQKPTDRPLELLRMRFSRPDAKGRIAPIGPTDGIMVWIEKAGVAK